MKLNQMFDNCSADLFIESALAHGLGKLQAYSQASGSGLFVLALEKAECKTIVSDHLLRRLHPVQLVDYALYGAAWRLLWLYDNGVKLKKGKTFRDFWHEGKCFESDRGLLEKVRASGHSVSVNDVKQIWQEAKDAWVMLDGKDWVEENVPKLVDQVGFNELAFYLGEDMEVLGAEQYHFNDEDGNYYLTIEEEEEEQEIDQAPLAQCIDADGNIYYSRVPVVA